MPDCILGMNNKLSLERDHPSHSRLTHAKSMVSVGGRGRLERLVSVRGSGVVGGSECILLFVFDPCIYIIMDIYRIIHI